MKFNILLSVLLLGISLPVLSQTECQTRLLEAERSRQEALYTQCGFDDEETALSIWAPWAEENQAYQALFEIYKRFPNSWKSNDLLQQSIRGENGSALIVQGDQFYQQGSFPQAITLYTKALKTPLLTTEEKGHVAQNIGLLYLNPDSQYYNPKNGLPIMKQATEQRSALANNIMGIYSLFGLQGVTADEKEAFFYLWRAVLLDCPVAQENLGIYYLLHDKKITPKEAQEYLNGKVFSCQATPTVLPKKKTVSLSQCDCAKVAERQSFIDPNETYRFVSNENNQPILMDNMDHQFIVQKGMKLPDGSMVQDIKKVVIILLRQNQRKLLYLLPSPECIEACQNKTEKKQKSKTITPYHFTFTPQECSDLLYYANQLVDPNLPFVGKKECGYSGNLQTANDLLLGK